MNYADFLNSEAIQKAASDFVAAFGGCFVGEEPGDRLVYETKDADAYTPPEDTTAEKVLQMLEESIQQENPDNPVLTLWAKLEYDPEWVY